MPEPVEWEVLAVVRITDGDTVRLIRSRVVNLDGRHYRLTDEPAPGEPPGVPVRLLWVDTPERGDHPGWENARTDLTRWLDGARLRVAGALRVLCYESGGWDRIMGDLIDERGDSAAQWMLTGANGGAGWPPYTGDAS